MKKEISFEERRQIQLKMLDEIDSFCRKNDIRYSIAFGTLLGAVRHKGFIPWDDDVDIMMSLPDLQKFKSLFYSEYIEYVDVDINNKYEFEFSRLAHKNSYCKRGLTYKSYGICIDLYVIIGLPQNNNEFFREYKKLDMVRSFFMKWRNRMIERLPIKTIPMFSLIQRKCRDFLFEKSVNYNKATSFYVIAGPLSRKERMIYNRDLMASLFDIEFEGRYYKAIADWDYYLGLAYGDYMQLPPEEQRIPYHSGVYYLKN